MQREGGARGKNLMLKGGARQKSLRTTEIDPQSEEIVVASSSSRGDGIYEVT